MLLEPATVEPTISWYWVTPVPMFQEKATGLTTVEPAAGAVKAAGTAVPDTL